METATLAGVAARRSAIYWLLAEFFTTCPDEVLIARLHRDLAGLPTSRAIDPLTKGLSALHDALPEIGDAVGITKLKVDHTRLFGGIRADYGPPPPYESVHRNASDPTALASAIAQAYFDAGFAAVDHAAPADHLGVELRFISLLCHGESDAWQGNLDAEAILALGRQRDFLDSHVLQWAPQFLELVRSEAQHPFIGQLAAFARASVDEDRALIGDLLAELERT